MNRITKSTLLIGLLCLGAAAIPGAAGAATAPKTAKFKASLKGEQNITWSYNRAPEGSCYGGENAGGSVRMFYETAKPTTVTAYEIRKDNPIWDSTHQRVMFSPGFQASATATMEGSHSAGPPPFPADCEENGGGVIPQPVDCATATALINVSLAYVNKDRLLLRGDATSWDPGFEELRNMFSNCPYWQGGPYTHSTGRGRPRVRGREAEGKAAVRRQGAQEDRPPRQQLRLLAGGRARDLRRRDRLISGPDRDRLDADPEAGQVAA